MFGRRSSLICHHCGCSGVWLEATGESVSAALLVGCARRLASDYDTGLVRGSCSITTVVRPCHSLLLVMQSLVGLGRLRVVFAVARHLATLRSVSRPGLLSSHYILLPADGMVSRTILGFRCGSCDCGGC